MKNFYLLIMLALVSINGWAQADLVINEISYNPPESGSDSTEFVEIYNNGATAVNLAGYSFTSGFVYTFPSVTVNAGDYIVVAIDSVAMQNVYGITAYQWTSGGLSNGGEPIALKDNNGNLVDSLRYDDNSPWPTSPDGDGHSLILCDPNSDNQLGTSWDSASTVLSGVIVNGKQVYGSPGAANTCASAPPVPTTTPTYPISVINNTDTDGVADSNGVYCFTKGLVLGVNMSGSGISFTLHDGEGINIFNSSPTNGYVVNEGDSILIRGTVDQYNGLTQLSNIDSISVINSGNTIPTPTVVTTLDETTESQLVRIENLGVTAATNAGGGVNYTLENANGVYTMRVDLDTDVDDSLSLSVGDSLCYVIGIGGQFDGSVPHDEGYQILPRKYTDVDTTCTQSGGNPNPIVINTYDIEVVRTIDSDGVTDSLGVYCAVEGIVYTKNLHPSGISVTIIDETAGINVFNFNPVNGYVPVQGDEIRVVGEIDDYNGLTQIAADSITVLSTGNCIPFPYVVYDLDEDTESEYIELRNVSLVDPSAWPAPNSNANLQIVTADDDTLVMRLDRDAMIQDTLTAAPTGSFDLVGIGGQFDSSNPKDEGYQIFPIYVSDINSVGTIAAPAGVQINEIMSSNVAVNQDQAGEFEDWFEIYNAGTSAIDLTGYFVSDDADEPTLYRFPRCNNDMTIAAGEYKIFWADEDLEQGFDHVDFKLSSGGEFLGLYTPDGSTPVDSVTFPALDDDKTYGVNGNDKANGWVTFEGADVTPAAANPLLTSVVEVAAENNALSAFPNPTTGSEINFNKVVSATVFNVQGQFVTNIVNATSLNVEALNSGIYIIKTEEGEIVKLIKR